MSAETALDNAQPAGSLKAFPPVAEPESGQKLLQFLSRRLHLPEALLHRWIRGGQIRINGSRSKPFQRVQCGDIIRIPPFAPKLATQTMTEEMPHGLAISSRDSNSSVISESNRGIGGGNIAAGKQQRYIQPDCPEIIGYAGDLWAVRKIAGLPSHPGTGHTDSLSSRLKANFATASFTPTIAHRLDKDSSGIVLVAASYAGLRAIHESLRNGLLCKEYLAWVAGAWPYAQGLGLFHFLRKDALKAYEKMRVCAPEASHARLARCLVRPIRVDEKKSLLQIRLLSGRTHQIRVQLASFGHPILGDLKYGYAKNNFASRITEPGIMLHAMRVAIENGPEFTDMPRWSGEFAVTSLPLAIPA